MYELSAPNIVVAPLEPDRLSFLRARFASFFGAIERFLEPERAQLPLWIVVAVGGGIVTCLLLGLTAWLGLMLAAGRIALGSRLAPGMRAGGS